MADDFSYSNHFSPEQQINVILLLNNKKFLESNAVVTAIDKNLLSMELIGPGLPADTEVAAGAEVNITFWTGWAHYRCGGALHDRGDGKHLSTRLVGEIEEQQRRDYFRLDLTVPVAYEIPSDQRLTAVEAQWADARERLGFLPAPQMEPCGDGFKVVNWEGKAELLPMQLNLSGGGIRFKMSESLEAGTLLNIELFLPLDPSRVIHVIAEVLRCNEIKLRWERGNQYMVAMRFHRINEKDRETIISYIFSEQRRLLKLSQERIV